MSNEKAAVEQWRAYAACNGPCNQGRKPCPSPQSCALPEPGRYDADAQPLLRWFGCAVAIVVACLVLAVLFGGSQ